MSRNLIRDGYTRKGYVAPVARQHEGLRFTYRPMLPGEWAEIMDRVQGRKPRERTAIYATELAKRILWWSEVDGSDAPVPVSPSNVVLLPVPLWTAVLDVVVGIRASDHDPEEDKSADDADIASMVAACESTLPPGMADLEAERKN